MVNIRDTEAGSKTVGAGSDVSVGIVVDDGAAVDRVRCALGGEDNRH